MAETEAERQAREQRERDAGEARLRRAAALDAYEAQHAAVHAQALAILNIKMNYTVLTWIYGTINGDLQQSLMLCNPNALVARIFLENEFLGQRESRALLLSAEFRTIKPGSSLITEFCRRLETMAAALTKFGDHIDDRTLVLTLLCGLSDKFRHMVSNLRMQRLFPTFEEARTLLLLEDIDVGDCKENGPGMAISDFGDCVSTLTYGLTMFASIKVLVSWMQVMLSRNRTTMNSGQEDMNKTLEDL